MVLDKGKLLYREDIFFLNRSRKPLFFCVSFIFFLLCGFYGTHKIVSNLKPILPIIWKSHKNVFHWVINSFLFAQSDDITTECLTPACLGTQSASSPADTENYFKRNSNKIIDMRKAECFKDFARRP